MIDKKFNLEELDLEVIDMGEVKEFTILCNDKPYTIRLDYNSLLNITKGMDTMWEILYVKCIQDNEGYFNNLLTALSYCSVEKVSEDFFIEEMDLTAFNIETLENIFKELAREVYDTQTMMYIDNKIAYKYVDFKNLEEIKELE